MSKEASQIPASEEAGQLARELAYISEREQTLSRYSGRLRGAVERIENIFGNPKMCRVCGDYPSSHTRTDITPRDHKFVPKIHLSLPLEDSETFSEGTDEDGFEYSWKLVVDSGDLMCQDYQRPLKWLSQRSRKVLKDLVKSGRLSKFLSHVAEELQRQNREYEAVAEMAEKMAAAAIP